MPQSRATAAGVAQPTAPLATAAACAAARMSRAWTAIPARVEALHDTETHRPGADHTDCGFHDAGLGATYGTQPSSLVDTPFSINTRSMPLPRNSRLALL